MLIIDEGSTRIGCGVGFPVFAVRETMCVYVNGDTLTMCKNIIYT